jgi:hypothetical protein
MYNEDIIHYQRRIFTEMININSIEEPLAPESLSSPLYEDDLSFFEKSKEDPLVKEFANMMTLIRSRTSDIGSREEVLRSRAEELKLSIEAYLEEGNG